MLISVDSFT